MRPLLAVVSLTVACSSESAAPTSGNPDAGADTGVDANFPVPGVYCGYDRGLPSSGPTLAPPGNGLEPATGLVLGSSAPASSLVLDLDGDGVRDLAYARAASVTVLLSRRKFAWTPSSVHLLSAPAPAMTAADLDGDGRPEIITATLGSALVIDRVTDDGIEPWREIPGNDLVDALAAGDLDGDGRMDLVVARPAWQAVGFLRGHGDGTFEAPALFESGNASSGLRVVDLDLDGHLDVVVVPRNGQSIGVLPGRGDGTFGPRRAISWGTCTYSNQMLDLDGDGQGDAIGNSFDSGPRAMQLHEGGVAAVSLPEGSWQLSGDFNGDHELDLLGGMGGKPSIALGTGALKFSTPQPVDLAGLLYVGGLLDVDGDGRLDLVGSRGRWLGVALATGPSTFAPATDVGPTVVPTSIAIGRPIAGVTTVVATDGKKTLFVSHTKARIWTRDADVTLPDIVDEVVVRDLDGDGVDDLLTSSTVTGLERAFGKKGGGFEAWEHLASDDALRMELVDVDANGTLDLVSLGGVDCARIRYDIAGRAEKAETIGTETTKAVLRDVDRDGRIDLVCGESDRVRWLRNTTSGFVTAGTFATHQDLIGLGDVDGDGHDDLVLLESGQVRTIRGTATFSFGSDVVTPYRYGMSPTLVDFDADGTEDLVSVPNPALARELHVASGRTDLTFAPAVGYTTFSAENFAQLKLGDVDGDGRLDVAMVDGTTPSLRIRYGRKP